ncbi:MAG: SIR2 family protein [Planctomycetota bacterium]|jgi:hypothetical protein
MRVLVLGAGASKSYDVSPSGQRMPIATDFFNTFNNLLISENPWVLIEGLIDYIHEVKQTDSYEYLESGIDIEELHSEIHEHMQTALSSGSTADRITGWRAYNELIFIFASTLNEIQNGPISNTHKKIAELLNPDDVIITFNWDTLIERAFSDLTSWQVDWGYGIKPKCIFRDGWIPPRTPSDDKTPRILKLHGSTNWLTGYPVYEKGKIVLSQAAAPETVYIFESATKPYNTHAGRYMGGYVPFSYGYYPPNIDDEGRPIPDDHIILRMRIKMPWKPEGTSGNSGLVSIPLIIPPVKQKSYDMFGNLFADIWGQAQESLTMASHIMIIGYSFPRTDHRSNQLFLNAFQARDDIPTVSIINPHPSQLHDKFMYEFGIPNDRLKIYQDYFSPQFPLEDVL